jgi:dephospho-CoA kinase
MQAVALVGMPGSGKSEVARVFIDNGYRVLRFGDITDAEAEKLGFMLTEENERTVREDLRKIHGMAAYAILNLPRIEAVLKESDLVIDGLYSWEEYKYLRERLAAGFLTLAVWAPAELRYKRLSQRRVRPLTVEQARARDFAEIENVNKGGPIAMADFTIINESSLAALRKETERIISKIRSKT